MDGAIVSACRCHCSHGCDRHFAGDSAFERHRTGSFSDPDNPRRCAEPWEVVDANGSPVFGSERGRCKISEDEIREPVEIWHLLSDRDRHRRHQGSENVAEAVTGASPGF